MAADVVPALKEAIETRFQNGVMRDLRAIRISKRIRDGTATLSDAHEYSQALGESLSKALTNTLTAENLPNGTLYYNIAQRTVVPELQKTHQLVNEIARNIQEITDQKAGIGLKSVTAKFPELRISDLIDKMTEEGISLDDAVKWLGEPIVNNSEAFVDDFVEANCKFRTEVGLKTRIVRKAEAKCCEWCAALEGSYEYGKAPEDIYRRHEFCRCTVTFETDKISQDVWSKRSWKTSKEDLARRKEYATGQKEPKSPAELINQANMLYKEAVIDENWRQAQDLKKQAEKAIGEEKARILSQIKPYKKLTPEERIKLYEKYQQRRSTNRR